MVNARLIVKVSAIKQRKKKIGKCRDWKNENGIGRRINKDYTKKKKLKIDLSGKCNSEERKRWNKISEKRDNDVKEREYWSSVRVKN